MSDSPFDVTVIGAGPGGYVCAIRAAQLGLKTALIEKRDTLGGTCLNIGCIPSKALLHSSELYAQTQHAAEHGIRGNTELDLQTMLNRKDKVVKQLVGGVAQLVEARGITRFHGTGKVLSKGKVEITEGSQQQIIETRHIVIATGSAPVELPFMPFDGQTIVNSEHALAFAEVPERLLVVGAGAIGLEMGSVWARLGSQVTVVEFLLTICGNTDADISKLAQRSFKKQGIEIHVQTKVTGCSIKDGEAQVTAEKKGKELTFNADKVLVAVGRRPYTEALGLDNVGIQLTDRGRIPVDHHLRTPVESIWAIGDVIDGPMLAHKAEEDGVAVAEWIAGKAGHVDWDLMPGVIYTDPEIALVGLSEEQAKAQNIEVNVGKFNVGANGRAIAQDATDGLVKLIADAKTDRLLGAAIIARGASEMISSIVAHMVYGGSAEDIARTIHAHPTLCESIKEAALAVDKRPLHAL